MNNLNDLYYQCKGIDSWDKCKVKLQGEISKNEFVKDTHEKLKEERLKKKFNL